MFPIANLITNKVLLDQLIILLVLYEMFILLIIFRIYLNINVFIFPVFKIKLLILNLNIFNFLCLLYLNYGLYL